MKLNLYKFEAKLYELLGVRLFRVLVFKLEKLIHIKDKGRNINYHLSNYDSNSLNTFIKYLFYNGSIHARNILFFLIYILFHLIFNWQFYWFDTILLFLAVKDIYCVMLQRYNYIRIHERKIRLNTKREAKLYRKASEAQSSFASNYDRRFINVDLQIIQGIKAKIANGENIVISETEQQTLQRIADALNNPKPSKPKEDTE